MKRLLFLVVPLLLSASPKTPSDLALTSTKDTVKLSWKDRASHQHGFKIFRDGKLIALTSANISTYTDRGLQPNKSYTYTIKSTDDPLNMVNSVKAEVGNQKMTFEVKGLFSADSNINIFIDSDNDTNTGYIKNDTNIKGVDYLLQANQLYKYASDANDWKWEKIDGTITKEYHPTNMSLSVSLDDIPHGQTIKYMGQVGSHDWGVLNHYRSMTTLNISQDSVDDLVFGARNIKPTALNKGTIFASTDGSGELCSQSTPCSARSAFSKVKAGDVLFLRGGVYALDRTLTLNKSGDKNRQIVIESYPGEVAVLDGGKVNPEDVSLDWNDKINGISLGSTINYVHIRKLEVRHMDGLGLTIRGSYNIVEGCDIHDNFYAGIGLSGGDWHSDKPYDRGYNIIRDNIVHENSDVGLNGTSGDGGNADGIWLGAGKHNQVIHNIVYANSDDGIDAWRSNDTYIAYNISYDNGRSHGDGNGFKLGGHWDKINDLPNLDTNNGLRAVAKYNIAYDNKASGFDFNLGVDVEMSHNTAYSNGGYGYVGCKLARTKVSNNISSQNHAGHTYSRSDWGAFDSIDNSWDKDEDVKFISTDPNSKDFLVPSNKAKFENIGAIVIQ